MKRKGLILIILVAVAIIIQLIPAHRPAVENNNPNDLLVNITVSDSVAHMLKVSCYNCHSNQTDYPWYSYVAPVSWLVASDVNEGREHLNFSEWNSYDKIKKAQMLQNLIDEVSGKDMPPGIYTIKHRQARLTENDRKTLVNWANEYGNSLFNH